MANQITPNPSVPTQIVADGLKFPKFINNLGIIPTSYKDSMSYYECLAWLCKYLEETVIPTVNQNGEAVQELQNLYIDLNSYVANYFENLDVQEEINNKLDKLVADGTLENLIGAYIDDEIQPELQRINNNVSTLSSRMDTFTNLAEGSTSGDAELTDIRVAANGFVYATAGDSVRKQVENIDENIDIIKKEIYEIIPTELGAFSSTDLNTNNYATNRIRTAILNLSGYKKIELPSNYILNLYEKNSSETSYKVSSTNGKLQYNFDSSCIYRFLCRTSDNSAIDTISIKIQNVDNIEDNFSNLNTTTDEINTIKNSNKLFIHENYKELNLSDYTVLDNEFYMKQNGTLSPASGCKSVMIPVKPAEKYRICGDASGNLSCIVYFDSVNNFVSADLEEGIAYYYEEITIPDGVYFMSAQTRHNNTAPLKVYKDDFKEYTYPFDIMSSLKRIAYIDNKLPYTISTLSKGYITITVDDGNSDIDVISKFLTDDYAYPLNLAIPPSTLYNKVTNNQGNGHVVKDICDYVVENGGEILTHSFTVITANNENNLQTMYDQFSNNKRILEDAGFNINGIILSGGTGEISDATTNMWARGYYNYSDRYGNKEPFYHPRTNIAKTQLATVKSLIDDCATNHTLLHLHFHGLYDYGTTTDGTSVYTNGFTKADLKVILDYIKTYTDTDAIDVVRFGYVYDNYGNY